MNGQGANPRPTGFVLLMLLLLAVPALLQVVTLLAGDDPSAELRDLWGVREGFEQRLEASSPVVRWAQRFYAPAVDETLKRGGSRALWGRRNWLFYRPAVDYVTGPALGSTRADRLLELPENLGDPAAVIVDFQRQLEAAAVELLVVPVPVKATLYPERLWQGADPFSRPNNPDFDDFVTGLEAAGVRVIDLVPALLDAKREGTPVFLPRDTHWTPEAAALAAGVVADAVRGLPLWSDLEGATSPFDHRRVVFTGDGDIYGMLAYAPWRQRARPMQVELNQVIADRQGRGPQSEESPILLLGDSLTGVFSSSELGLGQRGGFAEQLASELELPLDVIAMPAGGASRSRQALALRPQPLAGKRLVIWQLTQRDLMFATEGWATTPLPSGQPAEELDGGADQRVEVLAWLVETTRLPKRLDYADCLIAARYREVDSRLPAEVDLLTLTWGVRDWQPTQAAGFQANAFYRLVLEPLPPEIDLEQACWIDTVGLTSRPWWIVEAEPR